MDDMDLLEVEKRDEFSRTMRFVPHRILRYEDLQKSIASSPTFLVTARRSYIILIIRWLQTNICYPNGVIASLSARGSITMNLAVERFSRRRYERARDGSL
jgi:hypothetical protein